MIKRNWWWSFPLLLWGLFAGVVTSHNAQAQQFNARQAVSFAASGDNTVIAAVTGKQIAVYGFDLAIVSATTMTLKCGSTALTGAMTLTAYSKAVIVGGPAYWVCPVSTAFVINIGAALQTSGAVWFTQQ